MKNKITKKEWLKAVAKEVEALKKNATMGEINRLDFNTLDPNNTTRCIYGQMTGKCTSARAIELIHKGCKRFTYSIVYDTFEETRSLINGNVDESRHIDGAGFSINYYSAIETYIMLKGSKTENIIKYLKGETKKLVL